MEAELQRMGKTMTGHMWLWMKQRRFSNPLLLTGPKAAQESSDMFFPLCFWSCFHPHLVENALLMEEGTRGAVAAKSPSGLGLEMHLVVGLPDGVLLKYFNSFGFIKNKTPKTCYFFEYKEHCLSTTAGLIWEEGGLVLKKVVGEQMFYSGQHRMYLQYCKMQSEAHPLSFCISCSGPLASPKRPLDL